MASTRKAASPAEFIIRSDGFETDFPETIPEGLPETQAMKAFREDRYAALYEMSFKDPEDWFPVSLQYLHRVGSAFVRYIIGNEGIEQDREGIIIDDSVDLMKKVGPPPFIPGAEYVRSGWVRSVWDNLLAVFRRQIAVTDDSVELYITEKNQDLHVPGKIFFHLVENKGDDGYPFAFMATYSPESGRTHLPLRYALEEYRDDREKLLDLLSNIDAAASRSEMIASFASTGELMHPLGFTSDEAYTFLTEVPIYEECGIKCRIPNWHGARSNITLSAMIGEKGDGYIGLNTVLSFDPQLSIDGEPLTEEEIEALTRSSDGLARIKGKWVEVNQARLSRTLETLERARQYADAGISMSEALKMMFAGGGTTQLPERIDVEFGEWMQDFMRKLSDPSTTEVRIPDSFRATLRPYQETGVAWLTQLGNLGLGACLADDMGLGKTVQLLAYLSTRMGSGAKAILVVPPSLLGNWKAEAERFVPDMTVNVVHGKDKSLDDSFLTLTTYGMLARVQWLREVEWDVAILDEAQAIKNRETIQAKASKLLKARFHVALTGTPVENGLWDLWSIFDFINPGLLGDKAFFSDVVSNAGDRTYAMLRSTTSPFILRRLKTDRGIADDLPEKNEIKKYVTLTRKQAAIYSKLADGLKDTLKSMDPKYKSAVILSSLTKFKQICNHPDQYNGSGDFSDKGSGKMQVMEQICETIKEKRERVLVFTQYREMTGPLNDCLKKVFGKEGLVIHGGVPPAQRSKMVAKFNSQDNYVPYMVLSLKAGGVGLNLTSANHVIHFDRWWNPAVENQATDRAYRIGQSKEVTVYKLICKGTIEESIDEMIEDKSGMADAVVGTGESWITKMSNEEIMGLFALR